MQPRRSWAAAAKAASAPIARVRQSRGCARDRMRPPQCEQSELRRRRSRPARGRFFRKLLNRDTWDNCSPGGFTAMSCPSAAEQPSNQNSMPPAGPALPLRRRGDNKLGGPARFCLAEPAGRCCLAGQIGRPDWQARLPGQAGGQDRKNEWSMAIRGARLLQMLQ